MNDIEELQYKREHRVTLAPHADKPEISDYERIKLEYIEAYEGDDHTWVEGLSSKDKDEVLYKLLDLALIPLKGGITASETCRPYYEKVAERLAQDRIDGGEY